MVPELLMPAGTPDKLQVAVEFGANAVYVGLAGYSLRQFAGNFDYDDLAWAIDYCHSRNCKLYVAINITPTKNNSAGLADAVQRVAALRPDAIIVADPGVLELVLACPQRPGVHLSTQAGVTSAGAACFWFRNGLNRIILARELSVAEIAECAQQSTGEFEVFVHGAQCIAWSGRCFLSLYWAGPERSPREGSCAQACRWPYRVFLEDRRRPGQLNEVEEDQHGTYFFDSKDLCGLPILDRLVDAGVTSVKVEGRTRSELYLAIVADVYSHALKLLNAGDIDGFHAFVPVGMAELAKASDRGFSLHFLGDEQNSLETYNTSGSLMKNRNSYLGRVVDVPDPGRVCVRLVNRVKVGDEVEFLSPGLVRQASLVLAISNPESGEKLDVGLGGRLVEIGVSVQPTRGALVRLGGVTLS